MEKIKNYDDYYITENGKIYSKKMGNLLELKPYLDSQGKYFLIKLIDNNGIRKSKLVHRLVAEAFLPNPNGYPEINHKDKNTQNNDLSNLEWCTRKYNLYDSYITMSQNRNFKKSELFKDDSSLGVFDGIRKAASYAQKNYGVSKYSLEKYLISKNFSIKILEKTNRKTDFLKNVSTIPFGSTPEDEQLAEVH